MITKEKLLSKVLPKEQAQEIYNQWQESHYDYNNRQYTYEEVPSNVLILYDHYTYEDYSGYGHVICYDTEKDSFFEVFGSHCSCYGLEGQWEPEYCTIEEMVHATNLRIESEKERGWTYSNDGELICLKEFLEIE